VRLGVLRERFDHAAYGKVMAVYKDWFDDTTLPPPEPDKPVGEQCIAQYKTAVMKWSFKDQVRERVCSIAWGQLWMIPLENLHKHCEQKCPIQDRNMSLPIQQDLGKLLIRAFHAVRSDNI
jgi:hypothetical protein